MGKWDKEFQTRDTKSILYCIATVTLVCPKRSTLGSTVAQWVSSVGSQQKGPGFDHQVWWSGSLLVLLVEESQYKSCSQVHWRHRIFLDVARVVSGRTSLAYNARESYLLPRLTLFAQCSLKFGILSSKAVWKWGCDHSMVFEPKMEWKKLKSQPPI